MSLRPPKDIQKILISTTTHIVGEYEKDFVLVTHAWPSFGSHFGSYRRLEGHTSRNAFVISFKTEPVAIRSGTVLPEYDGFGETLCSYLAVLFGKRFDSHGAIESNGHYTLPDLAHYDRFCIPHLPQNNRVPRKNFPVGLNLNNISHLEPLILKNNGDQVVKEQFATACKFYLRALQSIEVDADAAYLDLITCGEIISNMVSVPADELLDEEALKALERISNEMKDGDKIARMIRGRLRQIKKRFVSAICGLLDDGFFENFEPDEAAFALKKETIRSMVAAAYDVRSKYVHTGTSFGGWVKPRNNGTNWEVQVGTPMVENKDQAKILSITPTYIGLERILRHCIIKIGIQNDLLIIPGGAPPN